MDDKHYEFLTRDAIEFQRMQTILLAEDIIFEASTVEKAKRKPLYKVAFDVPEYRLPFDFCYLVN